MAGSRTSSSNRLNRFTGPNKNVWKSRWVARSLESVRCKLGRRERRLSKCTNSQMWRSEIKRSKIKSVSKWLTGCSNINKCIHWLSLSLSLSHTHVQRIEWSGTTNQTKVEWKQMQTSKKHAFYHRQLPQTNLNIFDKINIMCTDLLIWGKNSLDSWGSKQWVIRDVSLRLAQLLAVWLTHAR